jgi:hypothetical protein
MLILKVINRIDFKLEQSGMRSHRSFSTCGFCRRSQVQVRRCKSFYCVALWQVCLVVILAEQRQDLVI